MTVNADISSLISGGIMIIMIVSTIYLLDICYMPVTVVSVLYLLYNL